MTSATSIAKTLRFQPARPARGGAVYRRLENCKSLIHNVLRGTLIAEPYIRNAAARA